MQLPLEVTTSEWSKFCPYIIAMRIHELEDFEEMFVIVVTPCIYDLVMSWKN